MACQHYCHSRPERFHVPKLLLWYVCAANGALILFIGASTFQHFERAITIAVGPSLVGVVSLVTLISNGDPNFTGCRMWFRLLLLHSSNGSVTIPQKRLCTFRFGLPACLVISDSTDDRDFPTARLISTVIKALLSGFFFKCMNMLR